VPKVVDFGPGHGRRECCRLREKFYLCSICRMYHKVGFVATRDAAMVWKDIEVGKSTIRKLVEPPQFVWNLPPYGATIVSEPRDADKGM